MTDFVVSARMVADATELVSEADQGTAAIDRVGASAERAGAKAREFGSFTAEQTGQLKRNADAINQVVRATNPAISNQQVLESTLNRVRAAYISGAVSAEAYAKAQQIAARGAAEFAAAGSTVARSAGMARMGTMMVGQQIQDFGMQVALGTPILRAFAMQAGQTALAVEQMGGGGAMGAVARFIGSTWGSVFLAAGSILALFLSQTNDETSATDQLAAAQQNAVSAAAALGQAEGNLGQIFDLATGKIRDNTEALRANAVMQATTLMLQGRRQVQLGQAALGVGQRQVTAFDTMMSGHGGDLARSANPQAIAEFQYIRNLAVNAGLVAGQRTGPAISRVDALQRLGLADTRALQAAGYHYSGQQIAQLLNTGIQGEEDERIGQQTLDALRTGNLGRFARPASGGRQRRGRRPTDQTEFGQDTADKLTSITQRFTDSPPQIEAVRKALAEVDDIVTDIERRHPPNMQALLDQANAARPIIEAGINKPFNDFIQSQQQSLQLLGLQASGHDAEAEALQHILQLEQQQGPLDNAKRLAILANVRAIEQEQRAVEVLHEHQQLYLNTLAETRKEITDTVEGMLSGDFSSLTKLPGQLIASFNHLTAERLVEQMFGPAFRQLQDHVTGADQVRQSNVLLAHSSNDAAHAIEDMGTTIRRAIDTINNPTTADAPSIPNAGGDDGDIVVTAQNRNDPIYTNPRQFFQHMVEGLLQGILGDQFAKALSVGISRAIEGAAVGSMVAGIGKSLGIKTSNTGGQIGGAIGGVAASAFGLPPIVGEVVGSVLGSLVGGLFSKPKAGEAVVSQGGINLTGNSATLNDQANSLAGSVQSGIAQVAQQLGGTLGSYLVSIGTYKDTIRVNTSGGATHGDGNHTNFGDDQAAAVSFAILDAIKDGAVGGLSAAVQKALASSPDLDKALQEALKVQDVETLLKGVQGAMEKQLREFEQQAAERVRIARQYGFDVVAIEKINADQRIKLEQDILQQQVGSLQQLLDDMNFGSLFEGSLSDQRDKIIAQLDQATADAKAGIDGAADRQAQLSRDLIDLSKQAFGTAGPEYASDLDRARSGAEQVIALENERLKAAEDAVKETNSQLNEANDQLAQQTAILQGMAGTLDSIAAGGGMGVSNSVNAVDTRRFSNLQ